MRRLQSFIGTINLLFTACCIDNAFMKSWGSEDCAKILPEASRSKPMSHFRISAMLSRAKRKDWHKPLKKTKAKRLHPKRLQPKPCLRRGLAPAARPAPNHLGEPDGAKAHATFWMMSAFCSQSLLSSQNQFSDPNYSSAFLINTHRHIHSVATRKQHSAPGGSCTARCARVRDRDNSSGTRQGGLRRKDL